jgi:hypothetical protein
VLYLLDANVLITAQNLYYPLDRVPEFWGWLLHVGDQHYVKIPIELYEEITDGKDTLASWLKNDECRSALLLDEEVDVALVARVVEGKRPAWAACS